MGAVPGTLHVGSVSYRRHELRAGYAYRREDGGTDVRFELARGGGFEPDVVVEVESEEEARALLRVLRFDASQAVATFRTASEVAWRLESRGVAAAFAGAFVAGLVLSAAFPAARAVSFGLALLAFLVPSTTRVGADGVSTRWLWIQRFLPATEIVRVARYVTRHGRSRTVGVEVWLRDGSVRRLPLGRVSWHGERARMLADRIRQVAEVHAVVHGQVTDALAGGRSGRDARPRLARLRALGSGATATHRVAPPPPEALLGVVEDATAAPGLRVAAAVALGTTIDPEHRARVAAAAESVVAPRLRVALEQVTRADADDDVLARHLDELEADSAGSARRPRG